MAAKRKSPDDDTEVTITEVKAPRRIDVNLLRLPNLNQYFVENPNFLEELPKTDEFWLSLLKKEGFIVNNDLVDALNKWKPEEVNMRDFLIKSFRSSKSGNFDRSDQPVHDGLLKIESGFKEIILAPPFPLSMRLTEKIIKEAHKTMESVLEKAKEKERIRRYLTFISGLIEKIEHKTVSISVREDIPDLDEISTYDQLKEKSLFFIAVEPSSCGQYDHIMSNRDDYAHNEIEYKLRALEYYLKTFFIIRIFKEQKLVVNFIVHRTGENIQLIKPIVFEKFRFLPPIFEDAIREDPKTFLKHSHNIWDGISLIIDQKTRWFLPQFDDNPGKDLTLSFNNGKKVLVKEYRPQTILQVPIKK